jgi:hypothetical protein
MLVASPALVTSIRPSPITIFPSNFSDVSSAIAPISYDLNSATRYDVNSAANSYRCGAILSGDEATTFPAREDPGKQSSKCVCAVSLHQPFLV